MKPLIILTGPTAVGKTSLSINLAKKIGGQIISADSMQVYKTMDIGTAKIMPSQMEGVKHHLIDILSPDEEFNVYLFKKYAVKAIENIYADGDIPIITGGTGFYIQSVLYDINFEENEGSNDIRKELEDYYKANTAVKLHDMLREIDEESAATIHENNVKRVIRAIEFYRQTGIKFSVHNKEQRQNTSDYKFLYLVLTDDREKLYKRIDKRVDMMVESGLIKEVKELYEEYNNPFLTSMQGIGYKEIIPYIDNKISLEEAIDNIKKDTRHFAKRQLTWFRREKDVTWINRSEYESEEHISDYIYGLCKEKGIIKIC